MYNFDKLSGLIIEKFKTRRAFAKKMNLSERSIYLKLQGKIEFKPSEIDKACELLNIGKEKMTDYFFSKTVQKTELDNKNQSKTEEET